MKNKISVIIPLYNAEKYIERTLMSVINQSSKPYEIIIVNDGSNDNGKNLAEFFLTSSGFENFKIITTSNKGHSSAANTGVKEASGDYVALIDSDDTWEENKILKVQDYLDQKINPAEVIFSQFKFINEKDELCELQNNNQTFIAEGFWKRLLVEGNLVYGSNSGVVVKKEIFLAENGYDEKLRACEDWDLWIRLAKKYQFAFFSEFLVNIRVHGNNQSGDKKLMMSYHLKVIEKHIDDIFNEKISRISILKMILRQQSKNIFKFYFSTDYQLERSKIQDLLKVKFFRVRTFLPVIVPMIFNKTKRFIKCLLIHVFK